MNRSEPSSGLPLPLLPVPYRDQSPAQTRGNTRPLARSAQERSGLALIALGALWVRGQVDPVAIGEAASGVTAAETSDSAQAAAKEAAGSLKGLLARENPLSVRVIGPFVSWVDCLNPLLAGLILLLSSFNRTSLGILLQLVGAAVTLVGHQFGVPNVGPVAAHQLTMIVGVVLAGFGIVVSRK